MQRSTSFSSRAIPIPPAAGGPPASPGGRATLTGAYTASSPRSGAAAPQRYRAINATDLSFAETNQVRTVWTQSGKEYLRDIYSLRSVLGELGLYPHDDEMNEVMSTFENKISFNQFLRYVTFLKSLHTMTGGDSKDADTIRAFVALGGDEGKNGDINLDNLRETCKKFHLTIDVDQMVAGADVDGNKGTVDFAEFKQMWELRNSANTQQAASPNANSTNAYGNNKTNNSGKSAVLAGSNTGMSPATNAKKLSLSGGAPSSPTRKPLTRSHRTAGGLNESSLADADLAHELITGVEVDGVYGDAGGYEASSLRGEPSTAFDTPRSVLRSLTQPSMFDGGYSPSSASTAVADAEKSAALRAFLLGADARNRQQDNDGNANNSGQIPKRRGSKRNMSRRYTTLPAIRAANGILATAADAERGTSDHDGPDGEDDAVPLSSMAGNQPATSGTNVSSITNTNSNATTTTENKAAGGYRAPSPMILSEYIATRNRPEGNKFGLVSPRGTYRGAQPPKKGTSSPNSTTPRRIK